MSAKPEYRTTRDGLAVRTSPTLDALRPLIEGVKDIERRIDCLATAVEQRRADEHHQQLVEMVDAAFAKHERESLMGPCVRFRPRKGYFSHDD